MTNLKKKLPNSNINIDKEKKVETKVKNLPILEIKMLLYIFSYKYEAKVDKAVFTSMIPLHSYSFYIYIYIHISSVDIYDVQNFHFLKCFRIRYLCSVSRGGERRGRQEPCPFKIENYILSFSKFIKF